MKVNLLKPEWAALESEELRALLGSRFGEPGQMSGLPGDDQFYLPEAGDSCRVALKFKGTRISSVQRGPAFDPARWEAISEDIRKLLNTPPDKIGRGIAFSLHRVTGSWRGENCRVQILPPPAGAPTVPTEGGEHPFVLEFPMHSDPDGNVLNNLRRRREHRKLALLLNVLLMGRVSCETRLTRRTWALLPYMEQSVWAQLSYVADIGQVVTDSLSPPADENMEVIAPEMYYDLRGLDGKPLRVPSDLDESICQYRSLPLEQRERFDRALLWLNLASQQWEMSMSASFASLVTAIEALTARGTSHSLFCTQCGQDRIHEVPGPAALFREFFESYAPGASHKKQRTDMYGLRSQILHGSGLIAFDEGRAFGWDPPWQKQNDLHGQLWGITRIAMRNYLAKAFGQESTPVPGAEAV